MKKWTTNKIVTLICLLVVVAAGIVYVWQPVGSKKNLFVPPECNKKPHANGYELTEPFAYFDPNGKQWTAPRGTITDGTSIPEPLIPFFVSKFENEFFPAAIVHDAYCSVENQSGSVFHTEPWEDVHKMFYHACLDGGTNEFTAKIMYAAMYLGGPAWSPGHDVTHDPILSVEVQVEVLRWCEAEFKERDLSLAEIDEWLDRITPLTARLPLTFQQHCAKCHHEEEFLKTNRLFFDPETAGDEELNFWNSTRQMFANQFADDEVPEHMGLGLQDTVVGKEAEEFLEWLDFKMKDVPPR